MYVIVEYINLLTKQPLVFVGEDALENANATFKDIAVAGHYVCNDDDLNGSSGLICAVLNNSGDSGVSMWIVE